MRRAASVLLLAVLSSVLPLTLSAQASSPPSPQPAPVAAAFADTLPAPVDHGTAASHGLSTRPSPMARGMLFRVSGTRTLVDFPIHGGSLGLRVPLFGPLFLDPEITAGAGNDYLGYAGRALLTVEHPLARTLRVRFSGGYEFYGERSTGDTPVQHGTSMGPSGGLGLRWTPWHGFGFEVGMILNRLQTPHDGGSDAVGVTVPNLSLGFVFQR